MNKTKKKRHMSSTGIILVSFLILILAGSLLLSLPFSSSGGKSIPYIDALFTAASSVCVTGLVTLPVVTTFSAFGQAVILVLIQVGGLGVIAFFSIFMIAAGKKLGIGYSMLIQDSFNLNSVKGIKAFVKKIFLTSFLIEALGALSYMTVFVKDFGARGIWISVFNSVSAFCNAGIDIISETSLCAYVANPVVNFTTALLIIFGGIGFIVWLDLARAFGRVKKMGKRSFSLLTVNTKIALSVTLTLIFSGGLLFFIFEYNNPLTIGALSLPDKLMASFFQSVTTRTAGFATVPQENLTGASALVSILLMMIGGSPVGTAGGIKTVTVAVIAASVISSVKQKSEVTIFNRSISQRALNKAIAIGSTSLSIAFLSSLLLSAFSGGNTLDIVYEAVSACATVGLSRGFTSSLGSLSKVVVICTMYLGRVGPLSLAIAFNQKRENKISIKNPSEEITVG